MSRLGRVALPRRRARLLAPDPWPRAVPGAASPIPSYLGSECEIILRICSFPGGFTRPTGDLGLQLYRRTDHVETRSPPYVLWPYCSRMLRIREIGEDELSELVDVARAAMPREHASVSGFVDWRNQAGDMVWLLAERDEQTVGAGYALTGWHTPPHRAIGAALVPPEHRGAGVGIAVLDALEGWAGDHGASELEGPVSEDDEKSLAWAAGRGYTEAGRNSRLVLDLTSIDAPDPAPPAGNRDRGLVGPARARTRSLRGRTRGRAGHPRRGGGRHRHARGVAGTRHAGRERRSARCLRCSGRRRGGRLREALALAGVRPTGPSTT